MNEPWTGQPESVTELAGPTYAELLAEKQRRQREAWSALCATPSIEAADAFLDRFFGSRERPLVVLDLLPLLFDAPSLESLWSWLAEKWSLFDLIPHARFQRAFRRYRASWSSDCLPAADRAIYDRLPARFEAYRGQSADKPIGLSWTLNRAVAVGFAQGHRGIRNSSPAVLRTTMSKRSVALVVSDRGEAEIMMFLAPTHPELAGSVVEPSESTIGGEKSACHGLKE